MKKLVILRAQALLISIIMVSMIFTSCGKTADKSSSLSADMTSGSKAIGAPPDSQLGFYVKDGVIILGDKPFYGVGANYFDGGYRLCEDPLAEDIESAIKTAADHKIPYLRIRLSPYDHEGMITFYEFRDQFFKGMDRCIELCEKYEIGIIATLIWTPMGYMEDGNSANGFLPEYDSTGMNRMVEYVTEIITRYKNSPAIWGWEVGNEFNLACDVTPDSIDYDELVEFMRYITEIIRNADGTNRIVTTGNSQNRHASYNLYKNNNWTADTLDEMRLMTGAYESEFTSIVSTHVYESKQILAGADVSLLEYLNKISEFSNDIGKPLYIGEYSNADIEEFDRVHEQIMKSDIQLATMWTHNNYFDVWAKPDAHHNHMFDLALESNNKYVSEGKQDTASYWSKVKKVFYK